MRFKLQRSKSTTQAFYFEIQAAGNFATLATSETYVAKADALDAIKLIQDGAARLSRKSWNLRWRSPA